MKLKTRTELLLGAALWITLAAPWAGSATQASGEMEDERYATWLRCWKRRWLASTFWRT